MVPSKSNNLGVEKNSAETFYSQMDVELILVINEHDFYLSKTHGNTEQYRIYTWKCDTKKLDRSFWFTEYETQEESSLKFTISLVEKPSILANLVNSMVKNEFNRYVDHRCDTDVKVHNKDK